MSKISVIMNCFNSDTYLREAIDSVYNQTYQDWEIVFWDNASTDKSAEIAQSYDEKVKYFRSDTTTPLGEARNLAIEKARGEYIAFLDCDDLWLPEKLEKQINIFQKDKKIAMTYTNTTQFNEKGDIRVFCKDMKLPEGYIFDDLSKSNFITLSSVVVRRNTLMQLTEIFDESFSMSEDWDLWLRISYGNKVGYVPEYLTKWRINPNSLTHTKYILFFDEIQALIVKLKKTFPKIEQEFSHNLERIHLSAIYFKCIGLWIEKKNREARAFARPYILKDKKIFIAYFMTFFPSKVKPVFERLSIMLQRIRVLFYK